MPFYNVVQQAHSSAMKKALQSVKNGAPAAGSVQQTGDIKAKDGLIGAAAKKPSNQTSSVRETRTPTPSVSTTGPTDRPLESPGQTYPLTRSVTDAETVEGRLTGLLDDNSRYIQQARDNAAQQANRRGLINSSIAAGAGQKAAIESALPIAQQDAQTFHSQGRANQDVTNTFRTNEQAFNMNRALKEQEQRHTVDRMNIDQVNREKFAQLESKLSILKDNNAARLQENLKEIEVNAQISAEMKRTFALESSRIIDSTQTAIKEIGMSDKTAEQQANAVKQMLAQRDASINMLKQLTLSTRSWNW